MNARAFFLLHLDGKRWTAWRTVCASLLLACAVLSSQFLLPRRVEACGPEFLNANFVTVPRPDFPLEDFARGRIGVVRTTFARSYLVAAYRALSGIEPDARAQGAMLDLWGERLGLGSTAWDAHYREWRKGHNPNDAEYAPAGEGDSLQAWRAARLRALPNGASEGAELASLYARNKDGYDYYLNCATDGINTATRTLDERVKQYGAGSAAVSDWVKAQDRVFSFCSSNSYKIEPLKPQLPDEKVAVADETLRRDRAYQIAAALFYAEHYDEARTRFRAVAQ
ncbi:MAG: hypothetical protein WCD76_12705, partial [Pyrinomonadaceae bacterium]